MTTPDLIHAWRTEAERMRARGIAQPAAIIESLADELEAHLRNAGHESVGLTEGARLSGYSADHLGRLIRDGEIENVGVKNAPKIRIMDLPRKPGCAAEDPALPVLQLERGRRAGGLEKGVERRRVRIQRGGDAS